jgi:hypothetical protein
MPRVDPYRDQYDYERFPDYEPSASGAMLFIALVAAIIVAAFLWATTYSPQNASKTGLNPPTISQPAPAEPRTNQSAR